MSNKKDKDRIDEVVRLLEINIQQHSGHHSDILNQVTKITDRIDLFEKKVDPMLQAFDESKRYKMVYKSTGITIVKVAGYTTAILAAVYFLKQFIGDIIKYIKL